MRLQVPPLPPRYHNCFSTPLIRLFPPLCEAAVFSTMASPASNAKTAITRFFGLLLRSTLTLFPDSEYGEAGTRRFHGATPRWRVHLCLTHNGQTLYPAQTKQDFVTLPLHQSGRNTFPFGTIVTLIGHSSCEFDLHRVIGRLRGTGMTCQVTMNGGTSVSEGFGKEHIVRLG